MPQRFSCSKGHTWEFSIELTALAEAPVMCPNCGNLGQRASDMEETQSDDDAMAQTIVADPTMASRPQTSSHIAVEERTNIADGTPVPFTAALLSRENQSNITGPYTIIRQHASGGLGCIQLARDEAIRRDVALKQIQPHLAESSHSRFRFVTEARVTGQLEHPGIVPVYTMGSDAQGRPYYVMKFVRGRTLDEVIAEYHASPNALVFRELLRRFVAICQAIAYAHSRGIIHRDIKPQNIMLGDFGETLVLDWGLAKDMKEKTAPRTAATGTTIADVTIDPTTSLANQASITPPTIMRTLNPTLTQDGQIIGTPAYMSPEQASGRTDLHGPTTDIYSLGAVLYKLLTSKAPNAGKGTGSGDKHTYQPPPAPISVNADIHPDLDRVCLKAIAERPEDRYQRAMELAQEIQRFLDDVPLRARRSKRLNGLGGWIKSNPMHSVAYTGLCLIVLILAIALATHNH